MFLKYKKVQLSLLVVIIVIAGCTQKSTEYPTHTDAKGLVAEINKNNPEYCGYKGSVILKITAPESKTLRLKINKTCDNNIDFFVSSYFGLIIAKGSYRDGNLEYSSPYANTEEYESTGLKAIKALEKYFTIPYQKPSEPYYYSKLPNNEYLFTNQKNSVFINSQYKIYKIVTALTDEAISYTYSNDIIKTLQLTTEDISMTLEFQETNSQWTLR